MSVETQINRIKANIASAYAKAAEKGAALPVSQNSGNLPETIAGIPKGSDFSVPLKVSADAGAVITARLGEEEVRATADSDRSAILLLPAPGDWVVSAELDGKELAPKTVTIAGDYTTFFDFNAPVLPEGYVQLAYIDTSTYQSYINTGKFFSNLTNVRVVLEVEPLAIGSNSYSSCPLFGDFRSSKSGTTYYITSAYIMVYRDGVYTKIQSKSANSSHGTKISSDSTFRKMLIDWNPQDGYAQVNDEPQVAITALSSMYFNMFFYICGGTNTQSSGSLSRVYSYKLYESGVLTQNMIPCKNDAGLVGMYDTVEEKFYSSANSSDPFIPGPAV